MNKFQGFVEQLRRIMPEQEKEQNEVLPDSNNQTTQEGAAEQTQPSELEKKLSEAEKQIESYKDLLLRKAAEFENFKRRTENETASIIRFAKVDLISDILPIADDFERSMKLGNNQKESEAFKKGIELIYQKLLKLLESQDVKPMDCLGKEFNVDFHDALMQIPREDVAPHTIVEEVEKGYFLHDKVIRHAKVVVSTSPPEDAPGQQPDTNAVADQVNSQNNGA
ncbi:MAG: nucleotide exchange factor GrpE [bacterium]